MAKKDLDLRLDNVELPEVSAGSNTQKESSNGGNKGNKDKKNKKDKAKNAKPSLGLRFVKFIREIISELKKVEWPPFKRTKTNPGVLANTSTVLIVVLFFLVIITAFDFGLAALLRLLVSY